jgi:ABC-type nitrate/sulfonate/bicarbonate transport system ATPase subunit
MRIAVSEEPATVPGGGAGTPDVVVRDLWLTVPGRRPGEEIPVLERVELEVRRGEFVCLVGPSGCGKTTLLNIVAGFLRPTRGTVFVEGEPVRGPDRRRLFIFQEGGAFPWLSVQENIAFGLTDRGAAMREQVVASRGDGRPDRVRARVPRELSGGMRQRVEIAALWRPTRKSSTWTNRSGPSTTSRASACAPT